METRSKRKQQELEAAAVAAPVRTRAQKAARTVGEDEKTLLERAKTTRRRQNPPRPASGRSAKRHNRALERSQGQPIKTADIQQQATGSAPSKASKEVVATGRVPAEADQSQAVMDRHKRDARKGLEEAAREAEQDLMNDGDLFGRGLNTSALHGLLRKLGAGAAGFDDMMEAAGGLSGGRFKSILTQLRSEDESLQLDALNQLNELLAVSMADSLGLYPVEQLIPILISLLQTDHNPDIMLLAARSLTFLADVLPACCGTIVRHGAVPALCERLLNIEYIDLAEQSLQALEKLSSEHAQSCLRHGALLAVLSYLDFFQTSVQRVAVATAAHMCRGITTENTDAIRTAVPILTNLLQYQDAKVVESASLALTRIAEATSRSPQHMEALCNQGLIDSAMQLVAVSEGGSMTSQLAVSTYYGLLKLLCACAQGSPAVVETLFRADISSTLRKLLGSSTLFSSATTSPGSILKSSDQLSEVISLADAMLPPVTPSALLMLKDQASEAELSGGEDTGPQAEDLAARRRFLAENLDLLHNFAENMLALLLQVYTGTVVQQVREKVLSIIVKIVQYSPPDLLLTLLKRIPISSFIASLLGSRDSGVLATGVRLAELLMLKLPETFVTMFLKEGVFHSLEQLAKDAPPPPPDKNGTKRASSRLKGKSKEKGSSKNSSPVEPAPIAALAEHRAPALTLRQAMATRAQRLVVKQFGRVSAGKGAETVGMKLLRSVCADLSQAGSVDKLLEVLGEEEEGAVSTFEFLNSGAVQQLKHYLLGEDLQAAERPQKLLHRLHNFTSAVSNASSNASLLTLIRKLQDGLAAGENLAVHASHVSLPPSALRFSSAGALAGHRPLSGDNSSISLGLTALSQPLKLNLVRAPHEEQLRNYGGHTVLIEPLASMSAVEYFLWPRVQRSAGEAARDEATKVSRAAAEEDRRKGKAAKEEQKPRPASPHSKAKEKGKLSTKDNPLPVNWDTSGSRRSRRPASKTLPIPAPAREQPQQRVTRSQASRAAKEAKTKDAAAKPNPFPAEALEEGTSPGSADPLIFFASSEGDMEADPEEDEEMQFDEEDEDEGMEEDLEDDGTLGLDRLQVHTVDLSDAGTGDNAEAAATAPPTSSSGPPVVSTREGLGRRPGQTYAQAAAMAGSPEAEGEELLRRPGQACTKLRFYVGGQELPSDYTIFQAVSECQRLRQAQLPGEGEPAVSIRPRRLWDDQHTLSYSRLGNPAPKNEQNNGLLGRSGAACPVQEAAVLDSPLNELLHVTLPEALQASQQVKDVLLLLKMLEAIHRLGTHLMRYEEGQAGVLEKKAPIIWAASREEFVSHKLTPKLAQQLKDVLVLCGGNMPAWVEQLMYTCKFLFPFDIRRRFFYCTSSGLFRALQHLHQQHSSEGLSSSSQDRDPRFGRIQRAKVRISRKRMLESAVKVMEMYASNRTVLELEYFNEAGTGLGPTLEFYTLLSHELQRKGLGMWRFDDTNSHKATAKVAKKKEAKGVAGFEAALFDKDQEGKEQQYVTAPHVLFPAPIHPSADADKVAKVLEYFKLLGRAMAKALQDNRLLDIPLSYVFYRAALQQPLDLYNIREIDPGLGKTLETIFASHQAWLKGGRRHPMMVDGVRIEDLCLTFELPGLPDYELKTGGNEIDVTAKNAGEYVAAVIEATLSKGIQRQMESFRGGFEEVLPLHTLKCFHEDEIEAMLCGQGEEWTVDLLTEALKFDHGYTASSTAIKYFLEILSGLDAADQRRFLQFVTGSPRLRPGGLRALQPRLTVVRKHANSSNEAQLGSSMGSQSGSLGRQPSFSAADSDLPSVMTCANYLKLPPYSSKAIMETRLLFAVREGQGSFDLS